MRISNRAHFCGLATAILAASAASAGAQDAGFSFKSSWKAEVSVEAKRMAVADVTGDNKPRLLLLEKDNTLTINVFSESTAKKEASVDLGKDAAQFVAGSFAKGKPAVIAVPGGLFYKEGDKYSRKDFTDVSEITGSVRFTDGTENFFFFAGSGDPSSYAVDLSGAKPVVQGKAMPDPMSGEGIYSAVVARLNADTLSKFGMPEEITKSGIFGFFAPKGNGKLMGLAPWNGKDASHIGTFEMSSLGPGGGDFKFAWKSPKLDGTVLDMAVGPDPKTGKGVGIYVLQKTGPEGKGRVVEFFANEKE
jgi:hypothetical protein